jgi:putative membrane protein
MTWGRTLWLIIILKLFVFFVVLRIFFFQPYYKGLNDKEKAEMVGKKLMK